MISIIYLGQPFFKPYICKDQLHKCIHHRSFRPRTCRTRDCHFARCINLIVYARIFTIFPSFAAHLKAISIHLLPSFTRFSFIQCKCNAHKYTYIEICEAASLGCALECDRWSLYIFAEKKRELIYFTRIPKLDSTYRGHTQCIFSSDIHYTQLYQLIKRILSSKAD